MDLVVLVESSAVHGRIGDAALDAVLDPLRKLGKELSVGLRPERDGRERVGEDELLEAGRLAADLELGAEDAAPGVACEVEGVLDAEVLDHVLELVDEELDGPERRRLIGEMRRASVSELVVEDDRDAHPCEVRKGLDCF